MQRFFEYWSFSWIAFEISELRKRTKASVDFETKSRRPSAVYIIKEKTNGSGNWILNFPIYPKTFKCSRGKITQDNAFVQEERAREPGVPDLSLRQHLNLRLRKSWLLHAQVLLRMHKRLVWKTWENLSPVQKSNKVDFIKRRVGYLEAWRRAKLVIRATGSKRFQMQNVSLDDQTPRLCSAELESGVCC